jgi:hypothetical protein
MKVSETQTRDEIHRGIIPCRRDLYSIRQRYGVTIDDNLPNLKRWGEDLIARPAVASTL